MVNGILLYHKISSVSRQEDERGSHSLIPHAVSQYYCLPTAQDLQDLQNPDCGSSLYEQDKTLLGMCVMLASGC